MKKANLHWRSGKCTSLSHFGGLNKRCRHILLKKVIKHTIIAICNAYKQIGQEDLERVEAWAHGGHATHITHRTLLTTNRGHLLTSIYPCQSSLPGKRIDRVFDDGHCTDTREVFHLISDDVLQKLLPKQFTFWIHKRQTAGATK